MAGGPARSQRRRRRKECPVIAEWYAVTSDGDSTLRITPGLVLGERDSGLLALNDPEPRHQWIRFEVGGGRTASLDLVIRQQSLWVKGSASRRHRLREGAAVKLPNNTLYISRDLSMPARQGTVLAVVRRDDTGARSVETGLTAAGQAAAGLDDVDHIDRAQAGPDDNPAAVADSPATAPDRIAVDASPPSPAAPGGMPAATRRHRGARPGVMIPVALGCLAVTGIAAYLVRDQASDGTARTEPGPAAPGIERIPAVNAWVEPASERVRPVTPDGSSTSGSSVAAAEQAATEISIPEIPARVAEAESATAEQPAEPPPAIRRARALLEEGHITYPPDDNAVAHLERLLSAEPGNEQAMDLLAECTTRLIDAAVEARNRGLDYQARNTLEEVLGFNPRHERANRLWREWVQTDG